VVRNRAKVRAKARTRARARARARARTRARARAREGHALSPACSGSSKQVSTKKRSYSSA